MASRPLNSAIVDASHSRYLLEEFGRSHRELIRSMAELDELTRGRLPSKGQIVEARWQISRASLARRTLWNRIYTELSRFVGDAEIADLKGLQEADGALLRASSAHIARWPIDVVMDDWDGYCRASLDIRWKMLACMGAEKRLVYPMLGAASD